MQSRGKKTEMTEGLIVENPISKIVLSKQACEAFQGEKQKHSL